MPAPFGNSLLFKCAVTEYFKTAADLTDVSDAVKAAIVRLMWLRKEVFV